VVTIDVPGTSALARALIGTLILFPTIRVPFGKRFRAVRPTTEPAPPAAQTRYHLQDGRSYLVHDPTTASEAFSELVRGGREGLLITSDSPDLARMDPGLQSTSVRWLAEERREDAISPADLLGLSLTIKDFIQKANKPVVMLHGIEYLINYNGFTPILRLIQGVSEANASERGILLLPVVPRSLDEKQEALLAAETSRFPAP